MESLIVAAVVWIACAIAAAVIADHRGASPFNGFVVGLVGGPIGLLMVTRW